MCTLNFLLRHSTAGRNITFVCTYMILLLCPPSRSPLHLCQIKPMFDLVNIKPFFMVVKNLIVKSMVVEPKLVTTWVEYQSLRVMIEVNQSDSTVDD